MADSPSTAPATVQLPGCKSLSQRALILAATGEGDCLLQGLSDCDDSRFLRQALEGLGVQIKDQPDGVLVRGMSGPPQGAPDPVDIGEAGSSLRFLMPLCAAGNGCFVLTGAPRLFERPHQALIGFLQKCGAEIRQVEVSGRPGLEIKANGLPSGIWDPPTQQSSQYLSGLMMAAAWSGEVQIDVPDDLPSRGYFNLTIEAIHAFRGAEALRWNEKAPRQMLLQGGAKNPTQWTVPGDPSGATFFLVGTVLMGGELNISPPWSKTHPEAKLLNFFEQEHLLRQQGGLWISALNQGNMNPQGISGTSNQPLEIPLDSAPDAGPALAVLGAYSLNGMILQGIERLRIKESDRVEGVQRLLSILGSSSEVIADSLHIHPVPKSSLSSTRQPDREENIVHYHPDGDHRLAMAAGIARLRFPSLVIEQADCVAKSFPDFWTQLKNAWS